MELTEAIERLIPLQVVLPDRRRPLTTAPQYAAEAFVAETRTGNAIIWLDPFWCEQTSACHIAYAAPKADTSGKRWVDQDPRYGPGCLAYQRPVIFERLERESSAWEAYVAWQHWRSQHADDCGRQAAWQRVEECFGDQILARRV